MKNNLTPELTLKELKVTKDTLEKIVYLCTEKNIDYSQVFQTYKDVCKVIDIVEKEQGAEEFNEEWRKVMSERIVKYLPTHEG